MENEIKYLEGQYDGNSFQRSAQVMQDVMQACRMEQKVKETQLQAWEEEESRIAQIFDIPETDEDRLGNLMKTYAEEDTYNEYLVDGAVLWCDQATLAPFPLPDGSKIILELDPGSNPEERCQSTLEVKENPVWLKGQKYATVGDTVKGVNVMPFRCNCKQQVNRNEEEKRINEDPECRKHGVCRHLMQLNKKWDNMPRETGYMTLKDGWTVGAGVENILAISSENILVTEEEGITMTSVLVL